MVDRFLQFKILAIVQYDDSKVISRIIHGAGSASGVKNYIDIFLTARYQNIHGWNFGPAEAKFWSLTTTYGEHVI